MKQVVDENLPTDLMGVTDLLEQRIQAAWDQARDARDAAQNAMEEITAFKQLLTRIRITALVEKQNAAGAATEGGE